MWRAFEKNVCRPWHVQWLQVATSNTRHVISLENSHNFISYRVQPIYSKSIGHISYRDSHYFCKVMRHNITYISVSEIHEMQVKIYIFWTALLKGILVLSQYQHLSLAVEYCGPQLWVLPVESLLTAIHWDSLRGKHSTEALPGHPRLYPTFPPIHSTYSSPFEVIS